MLKSAHSTKHDKTWNQVNGASQHDRFHTMSPLERKAFLQINTIAIAVGILLIGINIGMVSAVQSGKYLQVLGHGLFSLTALILIVVLIKRRPKEDGLYQWLHDH